MFSDERETGSVQLRKYPRLAANFPLTYVIDGQRVAKRGRTRDIGGGGIQFESNERVAVNTSMTLTFELRPGFSIELRGRSVGTTPDPAAGHRHRIAFEAVPDKVRDSILDYIFEAYRSQLMETIGS